MPHGEICVLDNLHSDISYDAFLSSMLMNEQFMLNVFKHKCMHKVMGWSADENVRAKAYRNPIVLFFP